MFRLLMTALLTAGLASATSITYSGSLIPESPTFNRPLSPAVLSSVGTNVFYDVRTFNLLAGTYRIEVTSSTFDSYLALYLGGFNPAAPLTNLIEVDDDSGVGLLSLIGPISLSAGQYNIVTTTYANGVTGDFTTSINSIPEPSTMLLSAAGLGLIVAFRRRTVRQS